MSETVPSTSTITRVTFFEDRAEVQRSAKASLPAGASWLVLDGIALAVDDASVSAGAGASARVSGTRVVRRVRQLQSAGADEIAAIEADQRAARARRVAGERAVERASSEEQRCVRLLDEWNAGLVRVPRGGLESWRAARAALAAALTRALDEVAAQRAVVAAARHDEERAALRLEQGRAVHPRLEAAIEVQLHCDAATDVELEVKYRTPAALWRPAHTARLIGDHELVIRTVATVWQRTGEDWRDIPCRFSTARPARDASPPLLSEDVLSLQRKQEKTINVAARDVTVALAGLSRGARVVEEMPGVEDGGEPLSYDALRPVTLPSDGQPVRVDLGELRLACSVDVVVYPELGAAAHVRATATLTGPRPLLAGPVRLARGASIVGRGRIAFVGQGEPFELGFGVDDGVRVRRRVDEKRETGLLGGQKITRSVRLYLSNLGAAARTLLVVERVPKSEIADVEVKLTASTGAVLDDQDGFARFTVEIPARGTRDLQLGYRLEAGAKVSLDL